MAYTIDEIEGIGPVNREKLVAADIQNTDDLLAKCGAADGRKALGESTGISTKLLLTWVNMADLMRVSGIGKQFSELLEAAGVDTVKELRTRRADNLATKMTEVNAEKHLAKTSPTEAQVQQWIDQAKALDPCISH